MGTSIIDALHVRDNKKEMFIIKLKSGTVSEDVLINTTHTHTEVSTKVDELIEYYNWKDHPINEIKKGLSMFAQVINVTPFTKEV